MQFETLGIREVGGGGLQLHMPKDGMEGRRRWLMAHDMAGKLMPNLRQFEL